MVSQYKSVKIHIQEEIDINKKIEYARKQIEKTQRQEHSIVYLKGYSHNRCNILRCINAEITGNVLEIGGREGCITEHLLDLSNKVIVLERIHENAFQNIYRNQDKEMEIYVGDYQRTIDEIQDYTMDCVIWLEPDVEFEKQKKLLKKIPQKIKKGGLFVYAVDNKYGIKRYMDNDIVYDQMTTEETLYGVVTDMKFKEFEISYPVPDSEFTFELYTKDNVNKISYSDYKYYFLEKRYDEIDNLLKAACKDGKMKELVASYVVVCKKE